MSPAHRVTSRATRPFPRCDETSTWGGGKRKVVHEQTTHHCTARGAPALISLFLSCGECLMGGLLLLKLLLEKEGCNLERPLSGAVLYVP